MGDSCMIVYPNRFRFPIGAIKQLICKRNQFVDENCKRHLEREKAPCGNNFNEYCLFHLILISGEY